MATLFGFGAYIDVCLLETVMTVNVLICCEG